MTKQAHQQASHYCGPIARATTARAHTQGGEDPDGGLSHPVFRPKLNAFLYVCQDQVSHIK
jgi:hypothetical protein